MDVLESIVPEGVRARFAPKLISAKVPSDGPTDTRSARDGEFRAGRALATTLIAEMGIAPGEILVGAAREPLWPPGVVGSISHTSEALAVAVAEDSAYASIGLDIELASAVDKDLWPSICSKRELAFLHGLDEPTARRHSTLLFSAKESGYKCQFPLTRQFLEFEHAEIHIDPERKSFAVDFSAHTDIHQMGLDMMGRYVHSGRHVITITWIITHRDAAQQPMNSFQRSLCEPE